MNGNHNVTNNTLYLLMYKRVSKYFAAVIIIAYTTIFNKKKLRKITKNILISFQKYINNSKICVITYYI